MTTWRILQFVPYHAATGGPAVPIEIDVEVETDPKQELLNASDAVIRLNEDLKRIAAEVDGRKTKDGWELEEGWKA